MQVQYRLDQGEVAQLIAAALAYNGIEATDVAFDVTDGLAVLVTAADTQLRVRDKPEAESESMTAQLLERMNAFSHA